MNQQAYSQSDEEKALSPFYPSAIRPKLAYGCDRWLFSLLLIASVEIPYYWATWWSLLLGLLLFSGGTYMLKRMAKADPLMSKVYVRSFFYRRYYVAVGRGWGQQYRHAKHWVRG